MPRRVELWLLIAVAVTPAVLNGWYNPRIYTTPWLFWTIEVLTWTVLPALLYIWGRRRKLFDNDDLGFHMRIAGRSNVYLFAATLVVFAFADPWIDKQLINTFFMPNIPDDYAPTFWYDQVVPPRGPDTGALRLLVIFYLAATAGFIEEMVYRGMMRHACGRSWYGTVAFISVSSAMFSLIHWEGGEPKLIYTAAVGVVFAVMRLGVGSLWPLILGHFMVDHYWLNNAGW